MKRLAIPLLLLVCLLAISAAAADLHCTALRPSSASLVLACSANRLEAQR
jgi:hypothetical protein